MKYTKFALASVVAFASVESSCGIRGKTTGRRLPAEAKVPKAPKDEVVKEAKVAVPKEAVPKEAVPKAPKGDDIVQGEDATPRNINFDVLEQIAVSEFDYGHAYGYACRFDSDGLGGPGTYEDSNSNEYFEVYTETEGETTLQACKNACNQEDWCVGVEYGSGNDRCELWRAPIGHKHESGNFGCHIKFRGAPSAVCRVDHSLILSGPYDHLTAEGEYYSTVDVENKEECLTECANDLACNGVEYHTCDKTCDIWTSEIGAIVPVGGNDCFRRHLTDYAPNITYTGA